MICFGNRINDVLQAIYDFILYKENPKATITATYNKLPYLGFDLNLHMICMLLLAYDGPDSGSAFTNFTKLPHLVNPMGQKMYMNVLTMPVKNATAISHGENVFRSAAHHIQGSLHNDSISAWIQWANEKTPQFKNTSLVPVAQSLTDASRSQGADGVGLSNGPFYWLKYLLITKKGLSQDSYDSVHTSFK